MQQSVMKPVPLSVLPVGARARIVQIHGAGDWYASCSLWDCGLAARCAWSTTGGRGLVVSSGAARVALGGGIVEKLFVQPLVDVDADVGDSLQHHPTGDRDT